MIRVCELTKSYGSGATRVDALKGVSLEVPKGGFASIMGPSGSGKSTLLNILGCLDTQTGGQYYLDGMDVKALGADKKAYLRNTRLGFVFQSFFLLPNLTAEQNIELPLIYRGDSRKQRKELVERTLNALGLYERRKHTGAELSGGQRQRVAIGRAIVCAPRVLFADEPTGNLDSKTGREIMQIFTELNSRGTTVILITHERQIAEYGRDIYRLSDGLLFKESGVLS